MAQIDPPLDAVPPPSSSPPASSSAIISAPPVMLVLVALTILLAFIGVQGHALWREWGTLQTEMTQVRRTAVVGYHNINPNPSYAQRPSDWFHDEGEFTLIWSGWKQGEGHGWFRVGRGEVDRRRISLPFGRDVVQAIDYPVIETEGGAIWERIPADSLVIGQELSGVEVAYPMQVLDKVEVINDLIDGHPFLIVSNPARAKEQAVGVYETVVNGHRVTMGLTGYFLDRQPMLYDRGTESLWVHEQDALRAIAGTHKGSRLPRIKQPRPVPWGLWRSDHPRSRLLVGADRTRSKPSL